MIDRKLISIVIPILNEEKNIPLIYKGVVSVFRELKEKYDYRIIFVNDGSEDKSGEIINDLSKSSEKVKYIEFSRNFGKEIATSAGIHHSKGDAVIIIDADLQHPPEIIPEFIKKWEEGAEVVVGARKENKRNGLIRKVGAYFFYKIINSIGDTKVSPNETDYRLIDKKIVKEFNRFTERNRITRGLIDWMGFKRDHVMFDVNSRSYGKEKYSFWKLVKLALSTFISHSLFPLKFAGYLGIIITFFSGIIGLFIFIKKYILVDSWGLSISGSAILAVIILFLIGIVLISIGLLALYIASIHGEVINRPIYVIRSRKL